MARNTRPQGTALRPTRRHCACVKYACTPGLVHPSSVHQPPVPSTLRNTSRFVSCPSKAPLRRGVAPAWAPPVPPSPAPLEVHHSHRPPASHTTTHMVQGVNGTVAHQVRRFAARWVVTALMLTPPGANERAYQ